MTHAQVRDLLDKLWAQGSHKMDWLRFEQQLADVLGSLSLDDGERVRAARELLDAHTRRGHFDAGDYFPTMEHLEQNAPTWEEGTR